MLRISSFLNLALLIQQGNYCAIDTVRPFCLRRIKVPGEREAENSQGNKLQEGLGSTDRITTS